MTQRRPSRRGTQQQRQLLATEAARLMVDSGVENFESARKKLVDRHAIHHRVQLPRDSEIAQALRDHQQLFGRPASQQTLAVLRQAAVEAMQALKPFSPRLTGAVLDGNPMANSPVCLHVYTDEPEAVVRFLGEWGIPFRDGAQTLRFGNQLGRLCTTLTFASAAAEFRLTVIPINLQRTAPLGPPGEPAAPRASLKQLQRLIAEGTTGSSD